MPVAMVNRESVLNNELLFGFSFASGCAPLRAVYLESTLVTSKLLLGIGLLFMYNTYIPLV